MGSVSKPYQGEHRSTTQSKAFGAHAAVVADAPNRLHGADAVVSHGVHAVHAPIAHAVHAAPVVAHAVHAPVVHAAPVVAHAVHAAPAYHAPAPAYHAPVKAGYVESYPDEALHTPTPTLLLMTTPRLASTLRNSLMVLPTLPDLTLLLFLMAESNTSSTLPTDMMDMSLMSPMREPLSTQRPQPHTRLPQLMPQLPLITLKSEIPQKTSTTNPRQSQSTKKRNTKIDIHKRLISR